MYIPQVFEVTDQEKAFVFIKQNEFGQLTSLVEGRLFSSYIPFYPEGDLLVGHMAKKNPQWKEIETQEVLITFQGQDAYISPSWYDSPGVPTWNYQAVHVYGQVSLITEEGRLKEIVDTLTSQYESSFETPWIPEYNESMLNVIVGFEIKMTDIQCKYKLSQNRSEQDRKQVIEALKARGFVQLSQAMKMAL